MKDVSPINALEPEGDLSLLFDRVCGLMAEGLSLWVEEGQLRLSGARTLIDEELVEVLRRHKLAVIQWLLREGFDRRYYPLSFGQQRLWYLNSLNEDHGAALNVTFAFGLKGVFDIDCARTALARLYERQTSLITAYKMRNHTPMQTVLTGLPAQFDVTHGVDVGADPNDVLAQVGRLVNCVALEDAAIPFDLEKPPLIRTRILNFDDTLHAVVITIHHIACDGWSLGLLFRDFITLYLQETGVAIDALPSLSRPYADFACEQLQRFDVKESARQLAFWREALAGADTVLDLKPDLAQPSEQSQRGAREIMQLDGKLLEGLVELSRALNTTLYTTLMTCYSIMLHQQSGQRDFIVGTDVANRQSADTAEVIGFFVNVVPVRSRFDGDPRFSDLVAALRKRLLKQMPYQEFPLDRIVDGLKIPRNKSTSPLVQALFVLQNTFRNNLSIDGLEPFDIPVDTHTTRFDLALFVTENKDGLHLEWNYSTNLFTRQRIVAMSELFKSNLAQAVADPESRLSAFSQGNRASVADAPRKKSIRGKLGKLRKNRETRGNSPNRLVTKRSLEPNEALQWVDGLPLVYEPCSNDVDLIGWAAASAAEIQADLRTHGALLFRGFDPSSVEAFEQFAQAVCPTLFGDYGDLPKAKHGEKIYRSTPYPHDLPILYHNESSHMQEWPRQQFFFCLKPSDVGGATPVVDTRKLYLALDAEMRDAFEQRGLCYTRNFTPQLDVSWQDYFKTSDVEEVATLCAERGIELAWQDDGTLRTREYAPAVRVHPDTGEKSFFNQIQLHHVSCLENSVRESLESMCGDEGMPRNVYFGDGSVIPDTWVESLIGLYEKHALRFNWQRGDVLALDNMSMAHARDPFEGERSIRVAMGQMMRSSDYERCLRDRDMKGDSVS